MKIIILLLLSACGRMESGEEDLTSGPTVLPLSALQLQQPENCQELKDYVVASLVERYTSIPHYGYCPAEGGDASNSPSPSPNTPGDSVSAAPVAGGSGEARAPDDVSGTNNQEAGIDEGDTVKADANGVVYVLSGGHLIVARGFPPQELTTLKQIDLGAHGTHLYLDRANRRLVVLARYDQPVYIAEPPSPVATNVAIFPPITDYDITVALFYDVSTLQEPNLIDQIRFKGYYADGRNIGDRLHLIFSSYYHPQAFYQDTQAWHLRALYWQAVHAAQCADPQADPEAIAADPAVAAAKAAFAERVRAVFETVAMDDFLPTASRPAANGDLQTVPFLSCRDVRHPRINASLGLQVIASVDTDGENLGATAVVNNAWLSYSSQGNLYLAETNWHWWLPVADGDASGTQTAIYKFAVSGAQPSYVATGTVSGVIRNQFGFSEYNGVLRVATSQNDWVSDPVEGNRRVQQSNVFVLADDNNGKLAVRGAVRGFGKGETLQSSRFLGDKGFVVTFRQVDPLFSFDLSDPANPQLMGELTIPGFSEYMHPYDDTHLITVGRAGGAGGTGLSNGIQLQLFDVSDLREPKLLHSYTPQSPGGWSWSPAEYDHKAFTFYKPVNLLAIPLQLSPNTGDIFSGVAAYEVSLTGFRELGRVDHADLALDFYCNSDVILYPGYANSCDNGWYVQWAAPRRSIVMTESEEVYLYTVSDVGLKAASLADLGTTLGSVLFPAQPYPWWYFIAGAPATEGVVF